MEALAGTLALLLGGACSRFVINGILDALWRALIWQGKLDPFDHPDLKSAYTTWGNQPVFGSRVDTRNTRRSCPPNVVPTPIDREPSGSSPGRGRSYAHHTGVQGSQEFFSLPADMTPEEFILARHIVKEGYPVHRLPEWIEGRRAYEIKIEAASKHLTPPTAEDIEIEVTKSREAVRTAMANIEQTIEDLARKCPSVKA